MLRPDLQCKQCSGCFEARVAPANDSERLFCSQSTFDQTRSACQETLLVPWQERRDGPHCRDSSVATARRRTALSRLLTEDKEMCFEANRIDVNCNFFRCYLIDISLALNTHHASSLKLQTAASITIQLTFLWTRLYI